MTDRNVDDMLVTTSDGGLVGVLYREDAERKVGSAAEARDEEACECD
jgi:hypothetical protein